jgi:hypothetical protein
MAAYHATTTIGREVHQSPCRLHFAHEEEKTREQKQTNLAQCKHSRDYTGTLIMHMRGHAITGRVHTIYLTLVLRKTVTESSPSAFEGEGIFTVLLDFHVSFWVRILHCFTPAIDLGHIDRLEACFSILDQEIAMCVIQVIYMLLPMNAFRQKPSAAVQTV